MALGVMLVPERVSFTELYYSTAWLLVGLWHTDTAASLTFWLGLFGAIAMQKITRDLCLVPRNEAALANTE